MSTAMASPIRFVDAARHALLPIPPKRYKIGELAQFTGLTRQTLHNYTHWGLIRASGWTAGGHRLYDESTFGRLARVMALRKQHTVEQMLSLLEGQDDPTPAA